MLKEKNRRSPIYAESQKLLEMKRQLWVDLVMLETGCSTIYKVSQEFSRPDQYKTTDNGTNHPSDWNKYKNGTRSPGPKTLKKVNKKVSRATYWFNLPMWEILEKPVSIGLLNKYLSDVRPDIANRLFTVKGSYNPKVLRKKIRKHENLIKFLSLDSSIDAINTMVILCAEIEKENEYFLSINHYYLALIEILVNFCQPFPFLNYFDGLFEMIKNRFFYSWDLSNGNYGKTIGYTSKEAWCLHTLASKVGLYFEDLCVLTLYETRKVNALRYHLFRMPTINRNKILKEIFSDSIRTDSDISPMMRSFISKTLPK